MDLQQINIKVFVTEDSRISYENFIKVFNRWMMEADQDDYLNYADYSFTHAGPRCAADFQTRKIIASITLTTATVSFTTGNIRQRGVIAKNSIKRLSKHFKGAVVYKRLKNWKTKFGSMATKSCLW